MRSRRIILGAFLATFVACDKGTDPVQPDPEQPDPPGFPVAPDTVWKGYGLSPVGFPDHYDGLLDFLDAVGAQPTGAVMQNGPWRDDVAGGTDSGSIPQTHALVFEYAVTYGYAPIAVFGWRSGTQNHLALPGAPANDWTNTDARRLFIEMVVRFANRYRPRWLFLGNESDFYYEQDPVDYARWVDAYEEAYHAIHAVSPSTKVGPVFNYEHLAGTGDLNLWTQPNWGALELHDLATVDVVGLTLYPFFGEARAADVPASYLDPLFARIGDLPLAVTETGWPGENEAGALLWEANEDAQVDFVGALDAMLDGRNVELVNWLFLNALRVGPQSPIDHKVFGSVSVRDVDGGERLVEDVWLDWSPND